MSTDYSALLLEYPAVISKDQLYRICHISKRKATWLLENGIIPCRDSGKKTRRFQIYTADVVNYLITLENEPQKVAIPVGIFTSNKYRKKRENPVAHLPRSELKKHLCLKWRSEPDALTITQISKITGYNMQTVGQWISKGKLQYVSCPDGRKVAKRWLIQFMTDYIPSSPTSMMSSRTHTSTTTGRKTRYTPKNCCGRSCWASTPCAGGRRASSSTGRQISPASVSWSSA